MSQSFHPPNRLLMGPGPSMVSDRVTSAAARPVVGHLDPTFVAMMDDVKGLLQYTFQCDYETTFVVSGPGSAGMEATVVNLLEPGDKIIICRNGVFGGRLDEMARRCGARSVLVDSAWGEAADLDLLEAALEAHQDASVVAFVHAETSTGAMSDAEAIARLAAKYDCLTIADCVTSLAGTPVEVSRWGLDAVYSGSQKCLSCLPGLSPVTFSERAMRRIENRKHPVQSWFLDVGLLTGYWGGGQRVYHHTAPVSSLYALHEALLIVREEGLQTRWKRHREEHLALAAGLEALGLEFIVDESCRLPQLNAVRVPEGVDDAAVREQLLLRHDIEIGGGLGPFAGKVWRIGLMGETAQPAHVRRLLACLGEALVRPGWGTGADAGVKAADRVYAQVA